MDGGGSAQLCERPGAEFVERPARYQGIRARRTGHMQASCLARRSQGPRSGSSDVFEAGRGQWRTRGGMAERHPGGDGRRTRPWRAIAQSLVAATPQGHGRQPRSDPKTDGASRQDGPGCEGEPRRTPGRRALACIWTILPGSGAAGGAASTGGAASSAACRHSLPFQSSRQRGRACAAGWMERLRAIIAS